MRKSLLLAVLCVAGCGSPESFEELSSDIQSAEPAGVNLNIRAQQTMVSETLAMTQIGGLIREIGEGIQSGIPGPNGQTEFVQLQLAFTSTDRLGNEGAIDIGTLRIPMADIEAANFENLYGSMPLELVDNFSPGPGADIVIEYCGDPESFGDNPHWCATVAEGLGIG
jgi:hypothetical protein